MEVIKIIAKSKLALLLLFISSLVCFFLLNQFTDLAIDDFGYKFIFSDDPNRASSRVVTFSDLMESQYNHYFMTNGRILVNGIAQAFLMSDNKIWFNIANSLMFGLLQIFIVLLLKIKFKDLSVILYISMLLLIWFLIPGPNHTLLWLDGSINYLWAVVLVLAVIYLHSNLMVASKTVSFVFYPFILIGGFIAGATHEVVSVGVSVAFCTYYLFGKNKMKASIKPLIIGFCLGTIFLVVAPGNFIRLEAEGIREATPFLMVAQRIWGFILSFKSMRAIIILVMVLVYFAYYQKERGLKFAFWDNYILIISIFISLCFILLAGAYQERVFFGVSIFSIILLLTFLKNAEEIFEKRHVLGLLFVLASVMVIEITSVALILHKNKVDFDNDEKTWLRTASNVFKFREKKVNRFVSTGLGKYDRYFWSNVVMSKYYGKEFMIFLPSELYENLFLNSKMLDDSNVVISLYSMPDSTHYNIYKFASCELMAIQVDTSVSNYIQRGAVIKVKPVIPVDIKSLDLRQKVTKLIYDISPSPVIEESLSCYLLETEHNKFLYFKAPTRFSMDEIKTFEVFGSNKPDKCLLKLDRFYSQF